MYLSHTQTSTLSEVLKIFIAILSISNILSTRFSTLHSSLTTLSGISLFGFVRCVYLCLSTLLLFNWLYGSALPSSLVDHSLSLRFPTSASLATYDQVLSLCLAEQFVADG